MIHPQAQWTAPTPLWTTLSDANVTPDRSLFRRPAILRFATDEFMAEFIRLLAMSPERLPAWVAVGETWRNPTPIPQVTALPPALTHQVHNQNLGLSMPKNGETTAFTLSEAPQPTTAELKLYQPAHQRFYLVSACLVCRKPGLPDRMLDINRGEKATFVIRRLKPADKDTNNELPTLANLNEFTEYAFILNGDGGQWQPLGRATAPESATLLPDEEQLPLFGVTYPSSNGHRRRLLSGLIPVGKRETYLGATITQNENQQEENDIMLPSLALFISQIIQPWRAIINGETKARTQLGLSEIIWNMDEASFKSGVIDILNALPDDDEPSSDAKTNISNEYWQIKRQTDEQVKMGSWYALLDFADALQTHLHTLWQTLPDGDISHLTDEEQALVMLLRGVSSSGRSLAQALADIVNYQDTLDGANLAYDATVGGPVLHFRDDIAEPPKFLLTDIAGLVAVAKGERFSLLENAINLALQRTEDLPNTAPPLPLAVQLEGKDLDYNDPGWFIIRCVYERTHCIFNPPVVLSAPSVPFQLAGFFDPDGPARPVRISLPLDTSPAGLRKFAKNTAFVMSDILACQVGQIRNMTLADLVLSVLPWPFHKSLPEPKDGPCKSSGTDVGMVCSLSIPIVTLCALILLIIMVNLFDFIFRWIQFFIVCFPIPGLKGKENT